LTNKVFIEGASIAALTAAARLSKFKYSVVIDGTCYQNTVIDGFTFDYGDLMTLPAVYRDFFQKTGKHFGQVLYVKPMDPAFVF
jgi:phytoene dehydrogenase-like protein